MLSDFIEILILSLIQGVTEFLPISSSSHLILMSEYLNFEDKSLSVDVSLHIGSFLAVLVYFYKDLINFFENRILFLKIIVSSLPTMIIGFFLVKSGIIDKIRNLELIAWTTVIFGVLLFISDRFKIDKSGLPFELKTMISEICFPSSFMISILSSGSKSIKDKPPPFTKYLSTPGGRDLKPGF